MADFQNVLDRFKRLARRNVDDPFDQRLGMYCHQGARHSAHTYSNPLRILNLLGTSKRLPVRVSKAVNRWLW